MYEDKTLICKDCNQEFVFTAGEQEFYAEKGFVNEPQRCKACRQAKKNNTMFEAVCDDCGGVAKVPFKPREDKPVYCSACFEKRKNEA
ncbi:MAG: zinc-ribbon domain containing protein [Clostridia bacterium]|nr:zinc-ribbon domain containing protein [Clostridia bacterium]